MIVALTPDLMDRSKVSAAAEAGDQAVRFVGSAHLLAATADEAGATLVVVDLSRTGSLDAIRELAARRRATGGRCRIVAFGSHVDRELLDEAAGAGCDQVLARSQFFASLADVLAG